jgi:Domain of unknown function (DUF5666)
MRRISFAVGMAVVLLHAGLTAGAEAQSAPHRIRGTIDQVSADTLTIRAADGSEQTVTLAPDVRIASDRSLSLGDIKAGDYIGTAANRQADGSLVAIEVTVFPEALRGAGEGQRPWDEGPNSSMTNANVDEVVTGTDGRTLKLSYKGGTAEVEVPPDVPIVTPVPGDRSLLIPGKAVVAFMRPGANGALLAVYLTVEKDGVKPP